MRIAYIDCFSGISGDMLLGALVDAGVPLELLQQTTRALNLGAELSAHRVDRNGIGATKVDVIVEGVKDEPLDVHEDHRHEHNHDHPHTHDHGHAHHHHHDHADHKHSHVHRGLLEIRAIIDAAPITTNAKAIAQKAFQLLGEAEAKIHNKDIESVHFHEVGSVDAIVDIVCGAVAADSLNIDHWLCSPLNVGSGTVKCAHGTLPVPAPATLELLKDAPIYSGDVQKELVTPTGAAMIRALVTEFGALPPMRISCTGYGAGARSLPGMANVARITIGESVERQTLGAPRDTVSVIEANIDDMSPQLFGYAMERLLEAGALDVFHTPVQMKKNRPGALLTVLARPSDTERLAALVFAETTTIGVRVREESRFTLAREYVSVNTCWGEVRIKIATLDGKVTNFAPEFEDCRRLAASNGVPLKMVMQEALRLYTTSQAEVGRAGL